jgi:hypothetical protein
VQFAVCWQRKELEERLLSGEVVVVVVLLLMPMGLMLCLASPALYMGHLP